ncbi:MAG: hypothetical protein HC836_16890 [Richelia sp. RM2_1_2]|nr:hypothetical protein [Richelia sp. RM2_1_2]
MNKIYQIIQNKIRLLLNKLNVVKGPMNNVYYLTKKEIEEYRLTKPMSLLEISSCVDLDRLRSRRRILFTRIVSGRGKEKEVIEMMQIVQRLYDVGEPFYY